MHHGFALTGLAILCWVGGAVLAFGFDAWIPFGLALQLICVVLCVASEGIRRVEAQECAQHEARQAEQLRQIEQLDRLMALERFTRHIIETFLRDLVRQGAPEGLREVVAYVDGGFDRGRHRIALQAEFDTGDRRAMMFEVPHAIAPDLYARFGGLDRVRLDLRAQYAETRHRVARRRRREEVMREADRLMRQAPADRYYDYRQAMLDVIEMTGARLEPMHPPDDAEPLTAQAVMARQRDMTERMRNQFNARIDAQLRAEIMGEQQRAQQGLVGNIVAGDVINFGDIAYRVANVDGTLVVDRVDPAVHAAATAKSLELLRQSLTPAQLADYEQHGYFDVVGSNSGARYRIAGHGRSFNVVALDGAGTPTTALCFQPDQHLPLGDKLLTQKLYLEHRESEACMVANFTGVPPHEIGMLLGL